jgi:hypothetical protein
MRTLQPLQQKKSRNQSAAAPGVARSARAFASVVPSQRSVQSAADGQTELAPLTHPAFSLADIPVSPETSPATTAVQPPSFGRRLLTQAGTRPVLQRKAAPSTPFKGPLRKAEIQAARGRGDHLDENARSVLEQKLNADLSNVRVHTDARSDRLTRSAHALAFTTGADIFFRRGVYRPDSQQGLRLLAHEVSHVVQQATGPVTGVSYAEGVSVSDPGDRFEQAAEANAARVLAGGASGTFARGNRVAVPTSMGNAPLVLQRVIPDTKEEWEKYKEKITNFKTAQEWVKWLQEVDEDGNEFEAVDEKVLINKKESLDLTALQDWEANPGNLKRLCDTTRQPLSLTPSSLSFPQRGRGRGRGQNPPEQLVSNPPSFSGRGRGSETSGDVPKKKSSLNPSASSYVPPSAPQQQSSVPPPSLHSGHQQPYILPPNPYYQQSHGGYQGSHSPQQPQLFNPYGPSSMQPPNLYSQQPYMQQPNPYSQSPFSGRGRGLPRLHPPMSEQSLFSPTQVQPSSQSSTLTKEEATSIPTIAPEKFEPLAVPLPEIGQHSVLKPHEFAFAKLLGKPPMGQGGDNPQARSLLLDANPIYIHRDITSIAQLGSGFNPLTLNSDFPGQIYLKGTEAHIINLVSDSRLQELLHYLSAIGIKRERIHVSKSKVDTQKLIAEQIGPALAQIKGQDIDVSAMPISIVGQLLREHQNQVQVIATNTRSGPLYLVPYPYYLLSVNGNLHLVVDIKWANGEIVKDALEAVKQYAKSIKAVNLHGIAGSLNEDLKRNTLVMPQGGMVHSVLPGNKPVEIGKNVNPEPVEGVKVTVNHGHVTNILQEDDKTIKQLQKQTATVEMEAHPLLQKLEEMKFTGTVRIIFTISDIVTSPEHNITQREEQTEQTMLQRMERNRIVIRAFKLEPK